MADTVDVLYRGPSGCLIAEGYHFHQSQVTRAPRDLVERLRTALPDHTLDDVAAAPVDPEPAMAEEVTAAVEESVAPAADVEPGESTASESDPTE